MHLSTWFVAVLAVAAAVLATMPGELGKYPEYEFADVDAPAMVHGWPARFLWRTPIERWDGEPTPAMAWALTDSVRRFRPLALVVDLALAGAAVAAVMAFWELRRRQPKRALQFTLRQLLVFTMAVALILGWWNHQRTTDREIRSHLAKLTVGTSLTPRLPLWVRALVGDESLAWLGTDAPDTTPPDRRSYIRPMIEWYPSEFEDLAPVLERFADSLPLHIGGADDSETGKIARITGMEQLVCDAASSPKWTLEALSSLAGHRRLRNLTVSNFDNPLPEECLLQIAKLPSLESLSIGADPRQVSTKWLDGLKKCERLRTLQLYRQRIDDEGIARLAGLHTLTHLRITAEFVCSDISALNDLSYLEELDLNGAIMDERAAGALALPQLRYLNASSEGFGGARLVRLLARPELLPTLEWICIDPRQLNDELPAVLAKLPGLRTVQVTSDLSEPRKVPLDRASIESRVAALQAAIPQLEVIDDVWASGSI